MKIQILNELNNAGKNTENFVCNENFLAVISIYGEDAETFLQGQFTTDIKVLKQEPNKVQISAWCNAKGRIIANFFTYFDSQQNKYFLILSADLIDDFILKLQKFILRSKVKLNKENNILPLMKITDEKSLILNLVNAEINNKNNIFFSKDITNIHKIFFQNGFLLITKNLTELFTPQMINFENFNGICYTKGCYSGQEVIARTHYLQKGQAKRGLVIFSFDIAKHLDNKMPNIPNDILNENNEVSGEVADVFIDENGLYFMAVIKLNYDENNNIIPLKSLYINNQIFHIATQKNYVL